MSKFQFLFLIPFVLHTLFLKSQEVKSKDGVVLGDRQELIQTCVESAMDNVDMEGLTMNAQDYCSCVTDELYPRVTFAELEDAVDNNALEELLFHEENLLILMECAQGNVDIGNEYTFGQEDIENEEMLKMIATNECVKVIMEDSSTNGVFTQEMATFYCSCAVNELYRRGLTYGELMEIEDEGSEVFNEIAVPCLTDAMNETSFSKVENDYQLKDIKGRKNQTRIELLDYLGQGYKIKIDIDGVSKYFIFDTGASDMVINEDLERKLLMNGSIKEEDYLEEAENYRLANNQVVDARVVRLNNIKIGDYTINNVNVAILEEGSLLCGKSFLDKFSNWEFRKDENILILYK